MKIEVSMLELIAPDEDDNDGPHEPYYERVELLDILIRHGLSVFQADHLLTASPGLLDYELDAQFLAKLGPELWSLHFQISDACAWSDAYHLRITLIDRRTGLDTGTHIIENPDDTIGNWRYQPILNQAQAPACNDETLLLLSDLRDRDL